MAVIKPGFVVEKIHKVSKVKSGIIVTFAYRFSSGLSSKLIHHVVIFIEEKEEGKESKFLYFNEEKNKYEQPSPSHSPTLYLKDFMLYLFQVYDELMHKLST